VVVKDEVAAKKAREAVAALVREFFFFMLVVLLELLFVSIKMHKDWINCGESYFESIDSFDVDVDFLKYTYHH
jgi:hypothetical protein